MKTAASRAPRVMVSCGEASGDLYAAALTRELSNVSPGVEVFGMGGARLADAGAEVLADYGDIAVTGLSEAIAVLPRSLRLLRTLTAAAEARRPDVFVAIDFPDFNFRLLPAVQRLGIPIVYYISPQIWAWRAGRIRALKRFVSQVLVIFPFEVKVYEQASVPVEFVGHPLIDLIETSVPREAWLASLGLDPTRPVVALLPGSRRNEVDRLLPVLADAVPLVAVQVRGAQFVVARAPGLDDGPFARLAGRPDVRVVTAQTDQALAAADAVVTASGTATVQTALHGVPMVIVYRLSALTYALGRHFVKLPHYGMVNLIAGRQIVPELIQGACTASSVADAVVPLLSDPEVGGRVRRDLAHVRARLGGPGASRRAAEAVLGVARRGRT